MYHVPVSNAHEMRAALACLDPFQDADLPHEDRGPCDLADRLEAFRAVYPDLLVIDMGEYMGE